MHKLDYSYECTLRGGRVRSDGHEKNLLVLFLAEGVRTAAAAASGSNLSFFSAVLFFSIDVPFEPAAVAVGEERRSRDRCVRKVATCRRAIVRDESTGVYSTLVRRCRSVWCEPPAAATCSRRGGVPATASTLIGLGVSPSLLFFRLVGELIELARSDITPTTEPTLQRPRVRRSVCPAVASRIAFRRSYLQADYHQIIE